MSRPDAATLHIRLAGKLLNGTEERFREMLHQNRAGEASRLLIDVAEVTFISSFGLHVLNELISERKPGVGKVTLTKVPQTMLKILKLTRIDRQLQIEDKAAE